MKQQIWYIGGGDSFESHKEFLNHLRVVGLWHLDPGGAGTNWKKALSEELADTHEFLAIPMPNRENADFEAWKLWFERHFEYMKGEPIFIGLSLGAMFLTKYLATHELPISPKHIFLIAGAYDITDEPLGGAGNFLIKPGAAASIAKSYPVTIMHSKDDFVVPFEHGEALAKALPEAEFMVFEDKNHFLIEEFAELVARIKAL